MGGCLRGRLIRTGEGSRDAGGRLGEAVMGRGRHSRGRLELVSTNDKRGGHLVIGAAPCVVR